MTKPKLKLTLQPFDVILEVCGAAILLLLLVYPLTMYADMPDTIPMHFDASGNPDRYAAKVQIWLLPILELAVYIGLVYLNRYPHTFNYPLDITEENAERQYQLATRFIRLINISVAVVFCYITYQIIQSAMTGVGGMGTWFLPTVILLTMGPIIWYLVKASRT